MERREPHYIDTHSHLTMLSHSPLEEILKRAKEAGLTHLISVSTEESNWESNKALSGKYAHVFYTLGLHPHDASRWKDCKERLVAYFPKDQPPEKCVGIGELGLDFHYNLSSKEEQITALEEQFELARRVNLPVIIHCRDAFDELFNSIRKMGLSPRAGVMHCFTGGPKEALAAMDLGLKISFSGILTFKNAENIRAAAKIIPQEFLMLETDCPYLAPGPLRGKPNEPAYLPYTAQVLAAVRSTPVEEIAHQTRQNAIEFFKLSH